MAASGAATRRSTVDSPGGPSSWLMSVDAKRIGMTYGVSVLSTFMLGFTMALVLRSEMLTPGHTLVDPAVFAQLFTLHGTVMVFLCVLPGIPAVLGNFVVPLMLGTDNLAYPRLNRLGLYLYVAGAICVIGSMFLGAVDVGWTLSPPLSTQAGMPLVLLALGLHLVGFSIVFGAINFLVTIVSRRPEGMGYGNMPMFLWTLIATSCLQIVAVPILASLALLLIAEGRAGTTLFDPLAGGDALAYQKLFWFFAHAAVTMVLLAGFGVVSEVLATSCRKPLHGYRQTVLACFSLVALALVGWGVHLVGGGQSAASSTAFSALSLLAAVPATLIVFNSLATLHDGAIRADTPLLYGLAFLFHAVVGGLSGLFLAALSTGTFLRGTYFGVSHLHYLLAGGGMTAFLAGLYYWWPRMFGRIVDERWGRMGAGLVFAGFNVTFLTKFVLGGQGMPQRLYGYPPPLSSLHVMSTLGTYVLAIGLLVVVVNLLASLLKGRPAPANPWGGTTLEWQAGDLQSARNGTEAAGLVIEPYDFSGQTFDEASGGFVREGGGTSRGR